MVATITDVDRMCPGRSTPPLLWGSEVRQEGGGGRSARRRARPDDKPPAAPLLHSQEQAIVEDFPAVPVGSSVVRGVQPADVEQVLDIPVLHTVDDDSGIPSTASGRLVRSLQSAASAGPSSANRGAHDLRRVWGAR